MESTTVLYNGVIEEIVVEVIDLVVDCRKNN
jgi:hypothetical protein